MDQAGMGKSSKKLRETQKETHQLESEITLAGC